MSATVYWLLILGSLLSAVIGFLADSLWPDLVALLIFFAFYVGNIFVIPAVYHRRAILTACMARIKNFVQELGDTNS